MKTRLIIAWLGNLIDIAATLYTCNHGFTEINPVMAQLVKSPSLFVLVKVVTMTIVLFTLWKNQMYKGAVLGSWFAATLYGIISIYYMAVFMLNIC